MTQSPDLEARVGALEARVGELTVETRAARMDAAAARHISAAVDRDVADLGVKVDANRKAINALGEQTRERFDAVDRRFDAVDRRFDAVDRRFDAVDQRIDALEQKVDNGFAEMRGKFDATAAGLEHIAGLVNTLVERDDAR